MHEPLAPTIIPAHFWHQIYLIWWPLPLVRGMLVKLWPEKGSSLHPWTRADGAATLNAVKSLLASVTQTALRAPSAVSAILHH